MVAAAIPIPPPRRAVAVVFARVEGIAQPVFDVRVLPFAQEHPLPAQRWQREQGQPVPAPPPTVRKPERPVWQCCRTVPLLAYLLSMPARKRPTSEDAVTARRILLDGLARDADIFDLPGELATLHPRDNTFPGRS